MAITYAIHACRLRSIYTFTTSLSRALGVEYYVCVTVISSIVDGDGAKNDITSFELRYGEATHYCYGYLRHAMKYRATLIDIVD